jgi:aerobic-type carbon monoxide dehydrogenase small subunit (CoxS/CutS family)
MAEPTDVEFDLIVNGETRAVVCAGADTLLDVLRDRLGLTGTKLGCGIGYCGACTVLVDDAVAHACCLLAGTLEGREISTVEGLALGETVDEVQQAFLDEGAIQCGYCVPGFVMSIRGLRQTDPEADEAGVRDFLTGNICRCSGYASIVRAALTALSTEDRA